MYLINYMVTFGVGFSGGGWLYGWPMTQSKPGLNLAPQWNLWVPQVHGSRHAVLCSLGIVHCKFVHSRVCSV